MKIPGFCIALFSLIAIPGKGICQEVIKKKKYTLTFESNYADFDPSLKKKLIETFFKVYPKLAKEYNKNTNREVKFMIDTAYKGVAATGRGSNACRAKLWAKWRARLVNGRYCRLCPL
jgi:hypothetical protein